MGDIVRLPDRGPQSPWVLIMIEHDARTGLLFEVCAYTGHPNAPNSQRMYLGYRDTIVGAAGLAQAKAAQLGITEIVDFTDATIGEDPDDSGGTA